MPAHTGDDLTARRREWQHGIPPPERSGIATALRPARLIPRSDRRYSIARPVGGLSRHGRILPRAHRYLSRAVVMTCCASRVATIRGTTISVTIPWRSIVLVTQQILQVSQSISPSARTCAAHLLMLDDPQEPNCKGACQPRQKF